jgi:hypothetical protein
MLPDLPDLGETKNNLTKEIRQYNTYAKLEIERTFLISYVKKN